MLLIISMLYLELIKLTSTRGAILEKTKDNHQCCLNNSISAFEDGASSRSPLVKAGVGCVGGFRKTFQQWIDYTVVQKELVGGLGLCIEGWRYIAKGILTL